MYIITMKLIYICLVNDKNEFIVKTNLYYRLDFIVKVRLWVQV